MGSNPAWDTIYFGGGFIMELILIYIILVALGFGIELKMELQMFKDIADAGYKPNFEVLANISKTFPEQKKNTFLSLLIPGVNFAYLADRAKKYQEQKPYLLDSLYVMDVISEMNDYEKREYEKKPTGLRAISVPIICQNKLDHAFVIKKKEPFGTSKIYYERNLQTDQYTILLVEGPAKHLSESELMDIIKLQQSLEYLLDLVTKVKAVLSQGPKKDDFSEREMLELSYKNLEAEKVSRSGESDVLKRTLKKPEDK